MAQRHDVGEDNETENVHAASTDTLNNTANEEQPNVTRNTAQNCTQCEEDETADENDGSTKDVAERCQEWHGNSTRN